MTQTGIPILVRAYSRRDGFILPPDGLQIEVQILPLDILQGIFDAKERLKYGKVYENIRADELAELQALALLVSAVSRNEWKQGHETRYVQIMAPREAERALTRLVEGVKPWGGNIAESQASTERARAFHTLEKRANFPWQETNWRLNEWMQRARPVVWLSVRSKRLVPGLYCDSMAVALGALLVSKIASPQSLSVCERCRTPFISVKGVQRFCSLRCGNADRKARERARVARRKRRAAEC